MRRLPFIAIYILLSFLGPLLGIRPAWAAFNEQMAISTEAISLGNAVTADPPGLMSVHYNPAGLSLLPDGKWFSQGVSIPIIVKTSKFTKDGDFGGILGGFNDDPIVAPTGHYEGTNTSGRMYIPVLDTTLDFLIAPTMGISYRKPGSRWTFAVGNYAPFAVGLVHGDPNDPTKYGGRAVYQQHLIYAAPAVSYRISDTLSIGLTVGFGQTAMGAEVDMRSPNDMVALTRTLGNATESLEIPILSELTLPPPWFGGGVSPYDRVATMKLGLRDDFTPNYNVGLLWEPLDWFSFGICYQSPIKVDLNGYYVLEYSDVWQRMVDWFGSSPLLVTTSGMFDLPTDPVPSQQGTMTSKIEFPQRVQFGVKVGPFDKLTLQFDLKWANWSVLKRDKFIFDQDIQLLRLVKMLGYPYGNRTLILKRNFRDTWDWGVGLKYQLLDNLELRLGYEWRKTPVRHNLFDLMYALPSLHCFGGGIGLKLPNKMEVDLAFEYLVNKGFSVADDSSTNLNSVDFTDVVYNPYAGLDYEQDTITYMASLNVSMPFSVMQHMMHEQMAMAQKVMDLLNPFAKHHPHRADSGVQGIVTNPDRQSELLLPAQQVRELVVKLPSGYLAKGQQVNFAEREQVLGWLKKWQQARSEGDWLKAASFYAPLTLVQGHLGRRSALAFLQGQEFGLVLGQDQQVKIVSHPRGVEVCLQENYFDSTLQRVTGRKVVLLLERTDHGFQVLREKWEQSDQTSLQEKYIDEQGLHKVFQEWQQIVLRNDFDMLAKMYCPFALLGSSMGGQSVARVYRSWLSKNGKIRSISEPVFASHPRGVISVFQIQFGTLLDSVNRWQVEQVWSKQADNSWKILSERHIFLDGKSLSSIENTSLQAFLNRWLSDLSALKLDTLKKSYTPYVLANGSLGRQAAVSALQELWVSHGEQIAIQHITIKDHPRGKDVSFVLNFAGSARIPVEMLLENKAGTWRILSQEISE